MGADPSTSLPVGSGPTPPTSCPVIAHASPSLPRSLGSPPNAADSTRTTVSPPCPKASTSQVSLPLLDKEGHSPSNPRDGPHVRQGQSLEPRSPPQASTRGSLHRSAVKAETEATDDHGRITLGPCEASSESSSNRKRLRLDEAAMRAEDARLSTIKAEAESDADYSPSTSRQSSPSAHSSTAADQGYGGAKRRNGDDRPALPRNIDRVYFGDYDIKTWYHSPYPIDDEPGPSSLSTVAANGNVRSSSSSASKHRNHKNGTGIKGSSSALGSTSIDSPVVLLSPPPPSDSKPKLPALWICEGCLKYMRTYAGWYAHKKDCPHTHPPGRKVYQRGSHTVWEVDGAKEKLYAQNLSLFGKLFIDHKTIFFDVEPFLFYVVTDNIVHFDYVLGFFSKEKLSYDDYNLACIITFPPFQKKGFGTLMIELSYYLSAKASIVGTPERPLSELGFKGYVSFWSAVVLRALALAFNEEDTAVNSKLLSNAGSSPSKAAPATPAVAYAPPGVTKAQQRATVHVRSILLGLTDGPRPDLLGTDLLHAKDSDLTEEERIELRKAKRANLGFGKDLPPVLANKFLAALGSSPPKKMPSATGDNADASGSGQEMVKEASEHNDGRHALRTGPDRRARHSTPSSLTIVKAPGGSAVGASGEAPPLHPALRLDESGAQPLALSTTLERVAQAANLRVEDAAFALSELGLLKMRLREIPDGVHRVTSAAAAAPAGDKAESVSSLNNEASAAGVEPIIYISQNAVKEAVLRRQIKRPVLDTSYVFV